MVALFHGWEAVAFLVVAGIAIVLVVQALYGSEIYLNSLVTQKFALLRGNDGKQRPSYIPRIIHQTWKNDKVTRESAERIKTWLHHNPGWEYKFWTNAAGREFMVHFYAALRSVFHLPLPPGQALSGTFADV